MSKSTAVVVITGLVGGVRPRVAGHVVGRQSREVASRAVNAVAVVGVVAAVVVRR